MPFFPFVYFLWFGIPILKIVLLDADKLVTSDVILQNFFSSLELSPEGQGMVNG